MTITRHWFRTAVVALGMAALLAVVPACGDDAEDETDRATGGDETSITVDEAWARTSPAVAGAGAVYLVITNDGDTDDALVGASVDAAVAAMAEIHETVQAQTQTQAQNQGSMTTMGGVTAPMMEMREVESIDVPAGETVTLEPGGYHVMLLRLVEPLVAGARVDVTLTFEVAGDIDVVAEVRDVAP